MKLFARPRLRSWGIFLVALGLSFAVDLATPDEYIAVLYVVPLLLVAELMAPAEIALAAFLASVVGALAIPLHVNPTVADLVRWSVLAGVGFLAYRVSLHIRRVRQRERERLAMQDFLGMVAHDLRTPLTTISGYAQLLLLGGDAERRRQGLQIIVDQAGVMNRLVGDLVDAARIGSGNFAVHPAPVDLVEVVRGAVEAQRAAHPGREFVLEAPDSLPCLCDADRLAQVVGNLLSNAHKFSPADGAITVRLAAVSGQAVCSVADCGVGIPADQVALLFRPYYRAGTPERFAGAGLGLYISQGIAAAHGGQLTVTSCPGQGSTFTITLPLPAGAERA